MGGTFNQNRWNQGDGPPAPPPEAPCLWTAGPRDYDFGVCVCLSVYVFSHVLPFLLEGRAVSLLSPSA